MGGGTSPPSLGGVLTFASAVRLRSLCTQALSSLATTPRGCSAGWGVFTHHRDHFPSAPKLATRRTWAAWRRLQCVRVCVCVCSSLASQWLSVGDLVAIRISVVCESVRASELGMVLGNVFLSQQELLSLCATDVDKISAPALHSQHCTGCWLWLARGLVLVSGDVFHCGTRRHHTRALLMFH